MWLATPTTLLSGQTINLNKIKFTHSNIKEELAPSTSYVSKRRMATPHQVKPRNRDIKDNLRYSTLTGYENLMPRSTSINIRPNIKSESQSK